VNRGLVMPDDVVASLLTEVIEHVPVVMAVSLGYELNEVTSPDRINDGRLATNKENAVKTLPVQRADHVFLRSLRRQLSRDLFVGNCAAMFSLLRSSARKRPVKAMPMAVGGQRNV
jgi:hypothetical protein